MKLYATLKNNRGGKKSTGDDTRLLIELSYGNKILGTVGLYAILDDKIEGYRVVWDKGVYPNKIIEEEEKPKEGWSECNHYATDERGLCVRCGYNTLHLTNKELKEKGKMPNDYGNIKCCQCGNKFQGLEGKEDTCPKCLKNLIA